MPKFLLIALLTCASLPSLAQRPKLQRPRTHGKLASKASEPASLPADPAIVAALKKISAVQIQHTIETLVSFGNRSTLSVEQPASSGHGIAAARDWIKSEFERYSRDCHGCLEVKLDSFVEPPAERIAKPTQISSVYAVLRGTDPEQAKRIFLVTGHYDSRNSDNFNATDPAPGANDDASGTAVSLECARVLSQLKFPATIIFLTVAGEEQGLYGSTHFAKMAKDNGWQIEGVLNNDIVGGNRTPGEKQAKGNGKFEDQAQHFDTVRIFSEDIPAAASDEDIKRIRALGGENDSSSRELARYIAEVAQAYAPSFAPTLIYRRDRYLRGGDHTSFNEQGFAAVRFTEWREDFHHQHQNVRTENGIEYGDLPKFVDFDYVARVARLNAATLAELASAPAPPRDVKIIAKELENVSRLAWTAGGSGAGVTYEALWRPTDESTWRTLGTVSDSLRDTNLPSSSHDAELAISKDNVVFAVRAVDQKGHKSLPVVPLPER